MITHAIHCILTNDIALNRAALGDEHDGLKVSAVDGAAGWGLGLVQDGRALVRRRPRLGNHVFDFATLVEDVPSRAVVGVVVADSIGALPTEGIPPFRFQNWLLAAFPEARDHLDPGVRDRVKALVPEHVAHTVEGGTDTEWLVTAAFARVAAESRARLAEFPPGTLGDLLAESQADLAAVLPGGGGVDAVVCSGRAAAVVAATTRFYWREMVGLDDDPIVRRHRRAMHLAPRVTPRPHFRALAVSSTPRSGPDWHALEPGQVLTYSTGEGAQLRPLAG